MSEYSPVIVFLVAWLLLALISDLGIEATVARILRIVIEIVAILLILAVFHWR